MREQEDDNVIPDQGEPVDGTIDLAKELYDKFKGMKLSSYGRFKVYYSDGSMGYCDIFPRSLDEGNHSGPQKYRIGIWVYYYPKDDNPIIPNDYLSHPIKLLYEQMIKENPEIKNYSRDVYDDFTFYMSNDTIYYKEGIMHLTDVDVLPSAERNVLTADYKLYDLLFHNDSMSNVYYLQNPPRFNEEYPLAMDKAIKKLKTVWNALKKGTYRGMEYEYKTKPTLVVHQKLNRYNKESRIIYPDFSLGISTGWPIINGKAISQVEDQELYNEFKKFIEKKFLHFDIRLS